MTIVGSLTIVAFSYLGQLSLLSLADCKRVPVMSTIWLENQEECISVRLWGKPAGVQEQVRKVLWTREGVRATVVAAGRCTHAELIPFEEL